MPFEDRFEAGQAVINLDDFAGERIEPGIHARKPVIDTCEAAIDARKPRHDRAVLDYARDNVH